MLRKTSLFTCAAIAVWALATGTAWGHFADDPNSWTRPTDASDQGAATTIFLGKVPVNGQANIVRTLQAIKVALKTPRSDSPEHANDIVCRIEKGMGQAQEYLDCATNRDYSQRQDATQIRMLSAFSQSQADEHAGDKGTFNPAIAEANQEVAIANVIALQPERHLHIPVNGAKLQELLEYVPSPAAATAAPAATTSHTSGSGTN